MVQCSCGKPIDKIPTWMQGIKTEFVCNNCPNRQTKNIAFVNLDASLHSSQKVDEDPVDLEEEADSEGED